MADNTTYTPGTGATIAADEISSVLHQRVKISLGADGSATDLVGDASFGADVDVTRLPSLLSAGTSTTGNITASSQSIALAVDGYSNAVFSMIGTYAGINIAFEGSLDSGTTYFAVQAVRFDANTIETTSGALTNTSQAWELSVNGLTHFRVRSTAYTSGTGAIVIRAASFATEPVPAINTHAVTQSGTWNVGTVTPGTAATNLGKARDSAAAGTDTIVGAGFIRRDAPTALTPAAGDYEVGQIDAIGRQHAIAGGYQAMIVSTPTISTSPAYTSGDNIGGKITLTNAALVSGGSGVIQSVTLTDKAKLSTPIDIVFFASDPSVSTITDNGAWTLSDTDLIKAVGFVSILAADYITFVDNGMANKEVGKAFTLSGTTSLFAVMVVRGTPTYVSTSDLTLIVGILQG